MSTSSLFQSAKVDTHAVFQQIQIMNFSVNFRNISLRDLRYFQEIARTGQLLEAAGEVGVTQPALTKTLQRLERALDCQLFTRTPKGLELTQAGSLLLSHASRIERAVGDAQRELSDFATGSGGFLRIGAGVTLTESLLPAAIKQLIGETPGATLRIAAGMNDSLLAQLHSAELDLVVSAMPEFEAPDLSHQLLAHDDVVVIARIGHPIGVTERIQLQTLARQQWVLPGKNVLSRRHFERSFEAHGIAPPRPTIETDSPDVLREVVASTDMLSFRPRAELYTGEHVMTVSELAVPELHWRRPIGAMFRRDTYLPPLGHRLIDILKTVAAGWEANRAVTLNRPAQKKLRRR